MTKGRQALRARRFQNLMPYRVREVLLVSSSFDAFILEEDGLLSEQLFLDYMDVCLSAPPRFTHVATAQAAFEAIEARRFDLILAVPSIRDMEVDAMGRRIKEMRPGRPVVLLALDPKELVEVWETVDRNAFDGAFLWSGSANILLAVIQHTEDHLNVEHDIENGDVRVIIMIEDSPRYYSSFLGLLYKELMVQSRSLYGEGLNELHRQMYLRSRPKILHATTFEEGLDLFERFKRNLIAVICDLRIPRGGLLDDNAGLEFSSRVRKHDRDMPVLLQSAEGVGARRAKAMNLQFVDKSSTSLLAETRNFLRQNLGFGDFVFRLPDGSEIDRATDMRELQKKLASVPGKCIEYHAAHNHFSLWLQARSEFELADKLRPRQFSEFQGAEAVRKHLIQMLRETQRSLYQGIVSDYSRKRLKDMPFARLGFGSLGGKGRGLGFFNRLLTEHGPADFGGLPVRLPQTVVITTSYFDQFLDENGLQEFVSETTDDEAILDRFLSARLPESLLEELDALVEQFSIPLAVRSSSLLEDSLHQLLAGVYSTVMLPNSQDDPLVRLRYLADAIKTVYASTFYRNARAYLGSTGHLLEEETMAVIIQPVVGQRRGTRFYPCFAGVAQSTNYYPLGPQRPEDGIVHVALGLGRLIVDGGLALRFSPEHPGVLPQFTSPEALLDGTQRGFFALDMDLLEREPDLELAATVQHFDLSQAEEDGSLHLVASVHDRQNDRLVDDLSIPGSRVITFRNVLQHGAIPLAKALSHLLKIASDGLGSPVEIEFAYEDEKRGFSARSSGTGPALYILQVRPMIERLSGDVTMLEFEREEILCTSRMVLGHGLQEHLRDIIYVRREGWEPSKNKAIAKEIGRLNKLLTEEGRPYVLIGPGRWGTADPWLGIPVDWSQISNVRVMVEASPPDYRVEPSQGTHFFQNMTALRLGYFTLPPGIEKRMGSEEFVDWEWLDSLPAHQKTRHLRFVRLEEPLVVLIDGRRRKGVIAKPMAKPPPKS